MLNERFMQEIPDELPEDLLKALAEGDELATQIAGLHGHVLTQLRTLQKRRLEAATKHGVMLDPNDALVIRVNLLVKHGLGILSDVRLNMEAEWVQIQIQSLEAGIQQSVDAKRNGQPHQLHMPNGGVLEIPVKGDEDGTSAN